MTDKHTMPLAFIDCETTGLHADRRPWEIAVIRSDRGQETVIQVNDVDLTDADPAALTVGGFHRRHVGSGGSPVIEASFDWHSVPEVMAAPLIERLTRGTVLVGINPAFDAATLAPLLRRHRLTPTWHYSVIDLKAMAAGHLYARPGDRAVLEHPWTSDLLSVACGVEPPAVGEKTHTARHTALGDARWAKHWYQTLTAADAAEAAA